MEERKEKSWRKEWKEVKDSKGEGRGEKRWRRGVKGRLEGCRNGRRK